MPSAENAWNQYSAAQQREVRTAIVLTTLGPAVRDNLTSLVSKFKAIAQAEITKLLSKKELSADEKKLLEVLQKASKRTGVGRMGSYHALTKPFYR